VIKAQYYGEDVEVKNATDILSKILYNIVSGKPKQYMYKANIEGHSFEIRFDDDSILVDDERFSWDLLKVEENYFHVIHQHKNYRILILKLDRANKKVLLKINNKKYEVILQDKFDLLLEKMGMNNTNGGNVISIKAPMPGLIIDLKVKDGDLVKQNDPLIVLEAMKMENVIKSPGDSVVKSVKVKKGESVEKNQILIEF
jgi:biotin carboxyl carrier protein